MSSNERDLKKQLWVRLTQRYYEEVDIEKKQPFAEIRVCVLFELEDFAQWLQENGNLKDFEVAKS